MSDANITDAALRRFLETVDAWTPYVEWVSIVAVGVKSADGLKLISGRVNLLRAGADLEHPPDLQVETEHILGRRQLVACSGDAVRQRVDNAISGRLTFDRPVSTFELRTVNLNPFPIRPFGITADIRLPTCRITGDNRFAALQPVGGLETADWELRANDPPYHGLDDLMSAIGLPMSNAMENLGQLEVMIVPPAIILSDCGAIRNRMAEVFVWGSPSLRVEDLSVSVKAFPGAGAVNIARPLHYQGIARLENRAYDTMKFVGDVGDDVAVRVFLTIKGLAVNQLWIDDPSQRLHASLVAAEVFDKELGALDQYLLRGRNDQAERFEWAVGTLLYLLGFRILRLGKGTPIEDGPDLLAITPGGHVAVVECTLGHPDNKDKVAKVLQRSARAREELNKTGFPASKVLPVVATPMPHEELQDAHADCRRRGALLVDREALTDLRRRAKFAQNPDQIFGEGISALSGRDATQD